MIKCFLSWYAVAVLRVNIWAGFLCGAHLYKVIYSFIFGKIAKHFFNAPKTTFSIPLSLFRFFLFRSHSLMSNMKRYREHFSAILWHLRFSNILLLLLLRCRLPRKQASKIKKDLEGEWGILMAKIFLIFILSRSPCTFSASPWNCYYCCVNFVILFVAHWNNHWTLIRTWVTCYL